MARRVDKELSELFYIDLIFFIFEPQPLPLHL